MKGQTLAEQHNQAAEIGVEHFREMFLLAFGVMTDGKAEQFMKHARKVEKFFREETTPAVWAQLAMIPDPEAPGQSLAESWLQTYERMTAIVGSKTDGHNTRSSTADRTDAARDAAAAGAY